jgi:hypothetical protein
VAGIAVASALTPHERTIELVSAAVLLAIAVYRTASLYRLASARAEPAADGPLRTYAGSWRSRSSTR